MDDRFYNGYELLLEIEGIEPDCLTNVSFSESVDLLKYNKESWNTNRANLQQFTINFTGNGDYYNTLRALKRARDRVGFTIKTSDDKFIQTGLGVIRSINRNVAEGSTTTWGGTIVGFAQPQIVVSDTGILQENGDYILQEDLGKILQE